MMSSVINGRVMDWSFKKIVLEERPNHIIYNLYTGDILQGQISKSRFGWDAIPFSVNRKIGLIFGFASRWRAAEFILQANGVYDEETP